MRIHLQSLPSFFFCYEYPFCRWQKDGALTNSQNMNVLEVRGRLRRRTGTRRGQRRGRRGARRADELGEHERSRGARAASRRTGARRGQRWGQRGQGALMNSKNMNVLEVRGRLRGGLGLGGGNGGGGVGTARCRPRRADELAEHKRSRGARTASRRTGARRGQRRGQRGQGVLMNSENMSVLEVRGLLRRRIWARGGLGHGGGNGGGGVGRVPTARGGTGGGCTSGGSTSTRRRSQRGVPTSS
jgi:hypothetical protein